MGVTLDNGQLGGIVRTVMSTPKTRELAEPQISFAEGDAGGNEYASNIQLAELNALNAAMAVIRWKKLCGFYADLEHEHHSVYTITTNGLVGDDQK